MLQALAQSAWSGSVALVERGHELGPGLPYADASLPFHTMGRTRTTRHQKGEQLRARAQAAAAALKTRRVELHLLTDTQVTALRREADGGWRAETSAGSVRAEHVVLATGHWHVHRLSHLSRAVDWRWDVRRLLAAIRDEEDVLVLGMGQSGIDVATALAERRGDVSKAGRVVLASRSGLLPSVFGHIGDKRRSGATRQLETLLEPSQVRLADVVAAVRADTQAVAGPAHPLPEWSDETLLASVRDVDGHALLRREVADAKASHAGMRPIPWHPVLWHGMVHFHALWPRLPAEDRLALAARWTPLMRHVEAIHVDAGERLLALLDEGRLELAGPGEDVTLREDEHGVTARGGRATVTAHRIVDARGPDPRIDLSDDSLVRSLLEAGHVSPARISFRAQPSKPPLPPEGWRVEQREGEHTLITGGLWVDPRTFAALDAGGRTHGLFTLGPLTAGQFPFYAGLWAARQGAARIVRALLQQ